MKSLISLKRYMRPYRPEIILGILTVILPVSMELLVPRLLQAVIDTGIRIGDQDAVVRNALGMFGAAIVGAAATLGQGVCRARLSQGIAFDLRNDLFKHILSLPFPTLDQLQTGGLMTRISSDVDIVRMFSSSGLALILRAVLMIIGSVIMMLLTDWQISLIMLACLVIAAVAIGNFMRLAQPLFIIVQERLSDLNTLIQENLAGTQVVKAFVREAYEIERFNARNADYMDQNIAAGRLMSLVMPTLKILTNTGIVAVIWLGGLDVIGGRLSVGELIAFNNYLMIGMTPLLLLGNMLTMASRAEASAGRIQEIFHTAQEASAALTGAQQIPLRGHIVFDNVTFRYSSANGVASKGQVGTASPNGSDNVLEDVTLEILPGQRVALLGATGAGKSTLVSLISRFYDTTQGRILIDGTDIREWPLDALRSQVGVVPQETLLFSGSVRDNLAYGNPDASMDDIIAAAKAAQAHSFIMAMSDGYDSPVEARGANLSGGQKQRIAIARALLLSPGILILDDSTSAVDLETEFEIQQALESLMADTTTLIIAQRISSVIHADQIIVLDGARVEASGSHKELMQSSRIYQEIYRSQLGTGPLRQVAS
jgi:ATP-binding cassette subfamily B multidrug efflux pump